MDSIHKELFMNKTNILKRFIIAGFLLSSTSTAFAADVGVSISVGQPGFYGQIDIGDYPYPQPRLIYREPIIVHRHVEVYEPMYLRVPPGHYKNWKRYCNRYNACGRQVYFVQDRWYHDDFAPRYRERRSENYRGDYDDRGRNGQGKHDHKRGNDQGKGKDRR
jgi:hypothetical protein